MAQKSKNKKWLIIILAFLVGALLIGNWAYYSCHRPPTEIVVGCQADLTGGFASWGYWINKGAKAAVDQINADGGVNGKMLRFVNEDTQSDPPIGQQKFRKLVLDSKADFVVGSAHSGVMLSTVPLAKEFKTVYLPIAMACEATSCCKGNRYIFRLNSQVCEQAQASTEWMVQNLGKKWTIVVADYSWGWSHEDKFTEGIEKSGGQVISKIRVPLKTKDFLPFISEIPKETDAIYFIFFGEDATSFVTQLYQSGYRKNKFTMICTMEAIDVSKLGPAVDGMYLVEYLPRQLKYCNTPYNKRLRELIGVDADGYEVGNKNRVVAGSHYWAGYEHVQLVAKAMRLCNYQSKDDTPKLIEALEKLETIHESMEFPQGDIFLRPGDHQGFQRHWMSRIDSGKIAVQFPITAKQVEYPAVIDFTKENF